MSDLKVVILAAGKGKRMKSKLPKVLHPVCGLPMVQYVLDAAREVSPEKPLVVVGYKGEEVTGVLGEQAEYFWQTEQLGTGHAVKIACSGLGSFNGDLLVLYGDTPLVTAATLRQLIARHRQEKAAVTLLSTEVEDPGGYGRVLRDGDGRVIGIVEDDQATPEEKAITEVNTGIYCFRYSDLNEALPELRADNAQGEYYLTDVVALLQEKGRKIEAVKAGDSWEILGPNDRKALAETERLMRQRILMHWMDEGVTFIDPTTTYVDPRVKLGADTTVYPGTHLYGETVVGEGCHLGPYTQITGSRIGNNCRVFFSVLDTVEVGDDVNIGPFANLRPGTVVEARAKVGDFVELKNSRIGMGSKVPHLSYIGDSQIGSGVNIGAGTITCNYDGKNKHATIIKDGAFIGSNTSLVAPVTIGENALVGAGSTITKDVPGRALAIARAHQVVKENWRKQEEEKD
ncbi:MAG: bifunctional UDP-N-acetylglucosamine diphosphorylase/glucosamine-1-phosphate N-acetyltransferase GlmU [Firmicutes bacterium]|jgi:bifunctional UDP-N-acetylglucosamine pyrophosphorylase/glucosamine-1-phosphate N-acetyltransferase|nr:bifunctional UDP-N-acetylglucosamine diphosphorylase/glucosamine-1-phosphate N-acetyltransferase GlmU [Bacillota bacterium]